MFRGQISTKVIQVGIGESWLRIVLDLSEQDNVKSPAIVLDTLKSFETGEAYRPSLIQR
jgi:hypothetical protein